MQSPKKSSTDNSLLARIDERTISIFDKIASLENLVRENYVRKDEFLVVEAKVTNNTKFRNFIITFFGIGILGAIGALIFTTG